MTTLNPLISIVIPNYNNEKYLIPCIESCLKQTYTNIEIVIVDDCSTDNSLSVIKSLQKQDARIRLVKNEVNLKVAKSRDVGVKNARADWITTLDSDDYYISDEKLQKEMEIIQKKDFNKYVIAFSGIIAVSTINRRLMLKKNTKEGDLYLDILTRNCTIPRDFLFSKELYFDIEGFDANILIYEDWDLKIRLAKKAKFYYTNIDGIGYRQHSVGLSSAKKSILLKWINHIFDKNATNLEEKEVLRSQLLNNFHTPKFKKILNAIEGIIIS